MVITEDAILARIETLKGKQQELVNNVNAYNGAIQDAEYWLDEIRKQEAPSDEPEA